jgi:hypothetical protein
MSDGSSITKNMNSFNIETIRLFPMDIKIIEEEECIILLCYFHDSWDNLVMDIGSNLTTLMLEDVVFYLLSEGMRYKNMKGLTKYALMVRGRLVDKDKDKFSSRKSKSKGRSKYPF